MSLDAGRSTISDEAKAIFTQQYLKLINETTVDPIMIAEPSKANPIVIYCKAQDNPQWIKRGSNPTKRGWGVGFRIVIGPDLVGEWRAKHGKK